MSLVLRRSVRTVNGVARSGGGVGWGDGVANGSRLPSDPEWANNNIRLKRHKASLCECGEDRRPLQRLTAKALKVGEELQLIVVPASGPCRIVN